MSERTTERERDTHRERSRERDTHRERRREREGAGGRGPTAVLVSVTVALSDHGYAPPIVTVFPSGKVDTDGE